MLESRNSYRKSRKSKGKQSFYYVDSKTGNILKNTKKLKELTNYVFSRSIMM